MSDRPKKYESVVIDDVYAVIPAHVLDRLEEGERYLVETMSKLEQRYDRLLVVAKKINNDLIDCGQRVSVLEEAVAQLQSRTIESDTLKTHRAEIESKVAALWEWRSNFTGKWAILAGIVMIVVPVLIKVLLDHLFSRP